MAKKDKKLKQTKFIAFSVVKVPSEANSEQNLTVTLTLKQGKANHTTWQ